MAGAAANQQGIGSSNLDSHSHPRVSIITPAHNAAQFLPAALDSVLSQSLQNWHWVIVNDGSTDGTASYLDALHDPRIEVVHRARGGVSRARNAGLDRIKGEFVTFLDADDALPPDSLAARVQYLDNHPEVTLVDGCVALMDSELGQRLSLRVGGDKGDYFARLIRLDPRVFFGVAVMLRTHCIRGTRFHADLSHSEDLYFLLQASDGHGWVYGSISECVYLYRKGLNSTMNDMAGLEKSYLFVFQKAKNLKNANAQDLGQFYLRVRRILICSWLRRGKPLRALRAYLLLKKLYRQ